MSQRNGDTNTHNQRNTLRKVPVMFTTRRSLTTLAAALTLLGTACGSSTTAPTAADAPTPTTLTTADAPTTDTPAATPGEPAVRPADTTPAPNPAPAPAPSPNRAAVIGDCNGADLPEHAIFYFVEASGLNVRATPSPDAAKIGVYADADMVALAGATLEHCARTAGGSVWWQVDHPTAGFGWVNAAYLVEELSDGVFPDSGSHVPLDHIDPPVEEPDVHIDCAFVPSIGQCVEVTRGPAGEVDQVLFPEVVPVDWAQLDCVYGGDADACQVLTKIGFGADSNYGLGNSLTQTPTEFLLADCDTLSGAAGHLACAELTARANG